MSNLVPEKRTNRLGHLVTRWVKRDEGASNRNTILGTVIPTIPASTTSYLKDLAESDEVRRQTLIRKISKSIREEFDDRPEIIGSPRGDARAIEMMRLQNRLDRTVKKMSEMESSTLQVILDTTCKRYSLIEMISSSDRDSELEFRERMHYMVVDGAGYGALLNPAFIEAVREAGDVDDLSQYPRDSKECKAVASTLYLLHRDWARRQRSLGESDSRVNMDSDNIGTLLNLLMEEPDRADTIKKFIDERGIGLSDVTLDLLDDYINTSTPALGDGLL